MTMTVMMDDDDDVFDGDGDENMEDDNIDVMHEKQMEKRTSSSIYSVVW